jgi:hypothetical protein
VSGREADVESAAAAVVGNAGEEVIGTDNGGVAGALDGGGDGGYDPNGAAEELVMGLVEALDTKLSGLEDRRREYESCTGGRGEGPRRRWRSDAARTPSWRPATRRTARRGTEEDASYRNC